MTRILYITGVLVVFGAVVGAGYFLRAGNNQAPAAPQESAASPFGLPTAPIYQAPAAGGATSTISQQFGVVAENEVVGFFVGPQNTITAVETGGRVVRIADGAQTVISSAPISNIISADFSFDGRLVLVSFGDARAPQYSVFDIDKKTWRPLPENTRRATWSPSDLRIVFFSTSETAASGLSTLDLGNPKALPKVLTRLHQQDLDISWPNPERIFLAEKGAASLLSSVWVFKIKTGELALVLEEELGLDVLWSPVSDHGLVFSADPGGRGGRLSLITGLDTRTNLAITSFPEKCAFAAETKNASTSATSTKTTLTSAPYFICGFPKNYDRFAVFPLPDTYQKRAIYALDDFYKIDATTGDVSPVFVQSEYGLDAEKLSIANSRLFFINRFDHKLYGISLR